jgi:hypothetical protein
MIKAYREQFNADFTAEKYEAFLNQVDADFPPIQFRLAETPVFIPEDLKTSLVEAGDEIIAFIKRPDFKTLTKNAIPFEWEVPFENNHPHFVTLDFGITKDEQGNIVPKLIEMQGFPSLYGFQMHLSNIYKAAYKLDPKLTPYFNGLDNESYIELLRKVIVGEHPPHQVVLMDLDVNKQKTAIDFYITAKFLGIKIIGLEDIFREENHICYRENGVNVRIKRIYNRLIFDEVKDDFSLFKECFDPREIIDVEWMTHPNWFYRISKYTMPFLESKFVPESFFLNEVSTLPPDLENYVLKPLFSFAGMGVIIDVTQADIDKIEDPENWMLQQKVNYEPIIQSPDGGVKTEIRLMYLWPDGEEPVLVVNLARLSRGKMIGVRYNKDFDWVGGTIGLMEP